MEAVVAWLIVLALHFAPPDRHEKIPGWNETVEERTARYHVIGEDIAYVVWRNAPLPGLTRVQTAAMVLSVSVGESGLQPDADVGPCYTKGPWRHRCDGGLAVGIMQVHAPPEERAALWRDRREVLRRGLEGLRRSLTVCRKLPPHERLALYNSGQCGMGRAYAARQWGYWHSFLQFRPLPADPRP